MANANPPSETKPDSVEGGFSGLGGKPMEPNRNPFAANPSTQTSESNLFGNAVTSSPNPFQNAASKPLFGSTGSLKSCFKIKLWLLVLKNCIFLCVTCNLFKPSTDGIFQIT